MPRSSTPSCAPLEDRYVRQYFYEMAAEAALEATILCSNKQFTNRMKITALFPEMNPSMDSYRCVLLEISFFAYSGFKCLCMPRTFLS
mmetsp:Transcript_38896/g.83786  ORF Transcript_38896/g.83786 Transcript_38896/m.83786 type:complete len:88 (+) Transcript_38896:123-386(+)